MDQVLLDLLVEARASRVAVWLALGSLSLCEQDRRPEERLVWLRARDAAADPEGDQKECP